MQRRHFCTLVALALLPEPLRAVSPRRGPHPDPRPGITAALVPPVSALAHQGAGRTFDQVRQIPQIVDGIRCHCGCGDNPDYYSLLSCYEGTDAMAQHCVICQSQGRLAFRLSKEGKSLSEIRAAIDDEFGDQQ